MKLKQIKRIHFYRKINFSVQKELSSKLIVRKTKFNVIWMCFLLLIIGFLYYKIQVSDDSVSYFIYLLCAVIALIGSVLKLILGYFFPEIVVDARGILLRGRQNIVWENIENIKLNSTISNTEIILVLKNQKKLKHNFENLNYTDFELKKLLRSYFRKHKQTLKV